MIIAEDAARFRPLTKENQRLCQTTNGQPENDVVRRSSLYREFQAERDEILRHKWIESEKAGHDIGFERALTDWIMKHRSKWRKSRQMGMMN